MRFAQQIPAGLEIAADPAAANTVLRNLIDNALRSSTAAGSQEIRLVGEKRGSFVELAVADDGVGFEPALAEKLFEKFYRPGDELRRTSKGTGLGLYVVRRFVELERGWVDRRLARPRLRRDLHRRLAGGHSGCRRWRASEEIVSEPRAILVVDDEEHLAQGIAENLEAEGYRVSIVGEGSAALEMIRRGGHDLDPPRRHAARARRLHDLRDGARRGRPDAGALPDREVERRRPRARLEAGGDDYLPKPFHLQELLARVKVILRRWTWYERATAGAAQVLRFGGNEFDFAQPAGARPGTARAQPLTQKEAMILKVLAERVGEVVSREELLDKAWGYELFPSTRTIDNFIVRLRKRFERDPQQPQHFHTVRGVGYRFTVQGESS